MSGGCAKHIVEHSWTGRRPSSHHSFSPIGLMVPEEVLLNIGARFGPGTCLFYPAYGFAFHVVPFFCGELYVKGKCADTCDTCMMRRF